MQHHSSFNASYDMGLNLENRFCRLAVHCQGGGGGVAKVSVTVRAQVEKSDSKIL